MTKNNPPLKVLFVTPECGPWVKTGGLGEVAAALPQALGALGHDVKVLMPAYQPLQGMVPDSRVCALIPATGGWPAARLVEAHGALKAATGFTLLLLDCPALYDQAGGPYQDAGGHDYANNALRFGLLSRVAAQLGSDVSPWRDWRADIVHANDWPTGLAPVYLSRLPGRAASIMTIHNLAFQGLFPLDAAARLGLPDEWLNIDGLEYWGQLSFMKGGLRFADAITTVSPTYALEIQDEPLGFGLQGVLRGRANVLSGILNGIDTHVWNPALDPHLAARYDVTSVQAGKTVNKAALQARVGLQARPEAMLFGLVSRLTEQKGIDLILRNLPWIAEQGGQLAALGKGEPEFEAALLAMAERHPGQVSVTIGFDESLAHQIEAGADCFLMPSRFEPCGLNQMYSQAYGTPPLVRATGGLADSVLDEATAPGQATGFAFKPPTPEALNGALQRAWRAFREPDVWSALQQRGMRQRFDWQQSASRYETLYRELRSSC